MKLSEELMVRGLAHQFTAENLSEIIDGPKRKVYLGIDPTADSIHVGNFVVVMLLRHLAQNGHQVFLLVGGGTAMIGDPKPDVERTLEEPEVVESRAGVVATQLSNLLDGQVPVVNNYDWLKSVNLIEFLRDIGKHFTVNELVKKDAIATRMSGEEGISYTEFAYPLLQAYDYLHLFKEQDITLQVGGSDQWGNIVAGVDLIRRKEKTSVHAITAPLVTDKATGKKFGKSEGNAVWLSAEKTSPYQFYQFWLNVSDESVVDYLKIFTLIPLYEIAEIEKKHQADPGSREAQKRLAKEVTAFVHGEEEAQASEKVSEILFGEGDTNSLSEGEIQTLLTNAPSFELKTTMSIVDLLTETNLATSKREARTFIESGAITVSGEKVIDSDYVAEINPGSLTTLKRGKKQFVVLFNL